MPDYTGKDIGRYHIIEPLGEGGMASVYRAYDAHLDTDVAVKFIRPENFPPAMLKTILARFEREARVLARLNHAAIVDVLDYGEWEGVPYLVMRHLTGGTLKKLLGKPLPYREAARLLLPVARALQYAHGHNILHRDVKPSNILLNETNEPVLTDFGIARILEDSRGGTLTGTGIGIGTPEYMAPEQGLGQPVDARADIYSLGVVLYELITGRPPFEAPTPMAVMLKHVTEPLPRARDFVPDLPAQIEQVIRRAMEKEPAARYPDMGAFADVLEKITTGAIPNYGPEPPTGPIAQPEASGDRQTLVEGALKQGSEPPREPPDRNAESESLPAGGPRWVKPALYTLGGLAALLVLAYLVSIITGLPLLSLPFSPAPSPQPSPTHVDTRTPTATATQTPSPTATTPPSPTPTHTPTPTPVISASAAGPSPTPTIPPTITPNPAAFDVNISEIMANPCGGEKEQLANEYIELFNYGKDAVDVTGWYLMATGQQDPPNPLVAWQARSPGSTIQNAITNSSVLLPGQYALILQPGYLTVESRYPQPYEIPPGTLVLTIGDGSRLGNKIGGLISSGSGPHDAIFIYQGSPRLVTRLVTHFGIQAAGPDPTNFYKQDGFSITAKPCEAIQRKLLALDDRLDNWHAVTPATPGK